VPVQLVELRRFSEAELIFDQQETKDILKFFFVADRPGIDAAEITSELRNLAQGLIVEGVDATYAMSWIELTFRWVAQPGLGMRKALQKLARRAVRHWFKHLKTQSLHDANIYERVRDQLARNFRSPFHIILQARAGESRRIPLAAFIDYAPPGHGRA
jgi:hypothetical protein